MLQALDVSRPNPGIIIPIQPWGGTTQMFWDSDLAKSIETIAYSLYRQPNARLEARADEIIGMYERLQDRDGYLNTWFQRVQPDRRWTNLRDHHELYCAGHLIEAAVAYFQATGKRKLLDVMCRFADYMIGKFGHGEGQLPGRSSGNRTGARQAGARHRGEEVSRSFEVLHRRARPGAALLHGGGDPRWAFAEGLHPEDPRIQPVP